MSAQLQKSESNSIAAWRDHGEKWRSCTACPIGCLAYRKVLGRGDLECDYVLCGEGPGKGEDIVGKPFVGRAGALLDAALVLSQGDARVFILNLVACRPTNRLGGDNRAPTDAEVFNCADRFVETLTIANPKRGIILMGRVPIHYFPKLTKKLPDHLQKIRTFNVTHPAAVCRNGGIGSVAFVNFVQILRRILNES